MIFVSVSDAIAPDMDLSILEQAALETIRQAGTDHSLDDSEATVLLTGDEQLHELNLKYLDVDAPTDVLSFQANTLDPETNLNYLGDVLISFPRAQAQAAAGGHPVEQELSLLVVHGMLHLLGYDHAEPGDKEKMWAVQSNVLKTLGCPLAPP
jgi:probable rRNA maturation factor